MAALMSAAWEFGSIPRKVMGSFQGTGIFLLSRDKMLCKIVGAAPTLANMARVDIVPQQKRRHLSKKKLTSGGLLGR
ncbi:uncharacterized protein PITG_17288 [Phytophthora infestans T30-4]|uniref:Uncharacterized protein n=1 Tax=Phytophthora infestans (strain T30-4) TaxID=403677 RepID=D0NVQ1_PHYIT|nr:uncharacterized protein PITG_17288 [Phytophthora infestans T30-4]EEY66732.1 hypothetical protein PITG_17288 [Phytophthora infestans T30-4]|eukprot:XP_002896797.1 hypothetical protein PITG_17288 [Phytophthora infestans T30-4]